MPKVLHHTRDTRDRDNYVYIGRPSEYGNPFKIGRDGNRQEVIDLFRSWLRTKPDIVEKIKKNLKGKDLGCWCSPLSCHGDVLLEIANEDGTATLVGGEVLYNVHSFANCAGKHCPIHDPSDHHMRSWRQHWRADRRIIERICPHGVGHPDLDDPTTDTVHGCDGCCSWE